MKKIIAAVIAAFLLGAVPSTDSRVDYTADGQGRTFTYNFRTTDISYLRVFVNGAEQTYGWSAYVNLDQDSAPGGALTFVAPPPRDATVRIERTLPITQQSVWPTGGAFKAKTLEGQLDKATMVAQQLQRQIDDLAALVALGGGGGGPPPPGVYDPRIPVSSNGMCLGWNGATLSNVSCGSTQDARLPIGEPGKYLIWGVDGKLHNVTFDMMLDAIASAVPTSNKYYLDTSGGGDTMPPEITSFTLAATSSSMTVPVTAFVAADPTPGGTGIAGYMITESSVAPNAGDVRWTSSPPTSFTFTGSGGNRTAFAWTKDAASNISTYVSAMTTITVPPPPSDTLAPTLTLFTIASTSTSLTVPFSNLYGGDNVGVTGYCVTETSSTPVPTDPCFSATYYSETLFGYDHWTFTTAGAHTLYAWAKDAAGNVSLPASATTTITLAGGTYYVSHTGNDSAAGTLSAPWRTLSTSIGKLNPGDTLYIRGSAAPDTNTACAADNAQSGACWVVPELYWNGTFKSGTSVAGITISAYAAETVIIEPPAGGGSAHVLHFNPGPASHASRCDYLTFQNLILDGRNVSSDVVKVEPSDATANNPAASTFCSYGKILGGKVRHGKATSGIAAYTYHWDYSPEVYENGGADIYDHGYYLQGDGNRIIGGKVHDNSHNIQVEWEGSTYAANTIIDGVEVYNSGLNPFSGAVSHVDAIYIAQTQGSGTIIRNCNIHDNRGDTHGTVRGIGVSQFGGTAPTGVTITNNHLWNNEDQTASACGPSIRDGNGSVTPVLTCSGNDAVNPAGTVLTPTFSPASGTYASAQTVSISDGTSGAAVHYTTDGSTPTCSSTTYSSALTVSSTTTLQAVGCKAGMNTSSVATATYTIQTQLAAPTFNPAAGTYTGTQSVTISATPTGAAIHYTTDGTSPTCSTGTTYSGAVSVAASSTLKAIACLTGYTDSNVATAAYTIQAPAGDTTAPTITSFTIATTSSSLTVPFYTLYGGDNVGVSGYCVNETGTTPSAGDSCFKTTYYGEQLFGYDSWTFSTAGSKTLYAWAKDAAGNLSARAQASTTITLASNLVPSNPQFDTNITDSYAWGTLSATVQIPTGHWFISLNDPLADGSASAGKLASTSLSGANVGSMNAQPAFDGEGYQEANAMLGYGWTRAEVDAASSQTITWDMRCVQWQTGALFFLIVDAVDGSGNNLLDVVHGKHVLDIAGSFATISPAQYTQVDSTTLKIASPASGTNYLARSLDLKTWITGRLNSGKTWSDVAKVGVRWHAYSTASGAMSYWYIDNFR